jgi:transcription antitermination factor NusG
MELIAVGELVKQDFPAFAPRIQRDLPGGVRTVSLLLPGYLFIRFNRDLERWRRVVSTPGIRYLFGVSEELPIPVPVGIVEKMIASARGDNIVVVEDLVGPEQLAVGEEVRVIAGPFADLRGLCRRSAAGRVVLLVEMMGRQVEFVTTRAMVERVGFEPTIEMA